MTDKSAATPEVAREIIAQAASEAWANAACETSDLWLTVADAIIAALARKTHCEGSGS